MSTNFKVAVTGEVVTAIEKNGLVLTSGSKGVYTAIYTTDAFWGGLTLEAVFIAAPPAWPTNPSARDIVRRSVPLADGSAFVHPDVLAKPGLRLWVGLQGLDEEGTIVKNSTLALVDKIQHGADPDGPGDGDIPATRYESLKETIGNIESELGDAQEQIETLGTALDNQRQMIETVGNNSLPWIVTVTGEDEVYTASQTYEDTMAAYNSGRRIVCVLNAKVSVDNGETYYAEGAQIPLHNVLDDGILIFQHGTVNPYGMSLEVTFMPDTIMAMCFVVGGKGEPGGSGGGITDTARNLLMTVLRNAVYTSNQSATLTALENALKDSSSGSGGSGDTGGDDSGGSGDDSGGETEPVTYTITNKLTNCTNSNSATSITANSSYAAVITAADGYELQSVVATMGGSAVTVTDGVISISAVTGNIVITAVASEETTETVEYALTPIFAGTTYPNKDTYETTPLDMSSGSAATVYASGVLFEPSNEIMGGTLHFELDTTKLTKCTVRIYLVNSEGNPYKHNDKVGTSGSTDGAMAPDWVSGDVTNRMTWLSAGESVKIMYVGGGFTCEIPSDCKIKWVWVAGFQVANIIDEELSAAAKPIYATVDAICFDGEVITAKIVKEA